MSANLELDSATQHIKRIHADGGSPLMKSEELDLIQRHYLMQVYLGVPKTRCVQRTGDTLAVLGVPGIGEHAARKQRGRKPQNARTQYDVSRKRWCGPYHRLIRLPALRNGTGYIDHALIKQLLVALYRQGIPRHKLVARVLDYFEHHPELPCPSSSTLRKIRAAVIPNSTK